MVSVVSVGLWAQGLALAAERVCVCVARDAILSRFVFFAVTYRVYACVSSMNAAPFARAYSMP